MELPLKDVVPKGKFRMDWDDDKRRLRIVIDGIPSLVVGTTLVGVINWVNRGFLLSRNAK